MSRCVRIALLPLILLSIACNRDPHFQSQKLVENGNKFSTKGKFKEASIMYRRALNKDPKNGDAYYRLGLAALKLSAYSDAAHSLRRAIDLQPNNADAATKLADLYWLAYTTDPAGKKALVPDIQDLSDQLLKRDANSFDGLRLAGNLELAKAEDALKLGRMNEVNDALNKALAKFQAANSAKPNDPQLGLTLASTLVALKRTDEAEKLGKQVLERNKNFGQMYDLLYQVYAAGNRVSEAESILQQKVRNNPAQENYRIQLASFYFNIRKRPEMEKTLQDMIADPKDFPFAHLSAGKIFARIGDYDRARREYEAGMAASPKEKAVYQTAMIELLTSEGKYQDATILANDVLKADPKNSVVLELRSALAIHSGDPQQVSMAVKDLQSLVSKNTTNAAYRLQLGRALMAQGQLDQARTHLEEALRIRPDLMGAKLLLAELLTKKGDFTRTLGLTDEILSNNPRNMAARLIRTSALLGVGDRKRAKGELEAIVKAIPNSTDAKFQLGFINYSEGNYKDALQMFRDLQQAGDPRGLTGILETDVAQHDFAGAAALVETELKKDPDRADLRMALASVMARSGQFDESIKNFQILIAKSPKSADYEIKLAETYRLKGDFNSAVEHFRKASALAPNDVLPLSRVAMLLDGVGRRGEAKPIYEQILRIEPDNVLALNNLAFIKAEEGIDLDQALSYAQRAKQRVPQNPDISDTLGWIYIKKNLSDDAVRIFRELVKEKPENATYRYHLAMALFQKGDRPTAKQECEVALKNNPSKDEQTKIKELMGKLT